MKKFNFQHICYITKTPSGLDWPLTDKVMNQGVYQLWYNGVVIKNGCWGEGTTKRINKRISSYRSETVLKRKTAALILLTLLIKD